MKIYGTSDLGIHRSLWFIIYIVMVLLVWIKTNHLRFVLVVKWVGVLRCHFLFPIMFPLNLYSKFIVIFCDRPAPVSSFQGFKYYALLVDDFTQFSWIYPLKKKSDFFRCFIVSHKLVEKQFDKTIKIFQSDGGGEFSSKDFLKYLADHGPSIIMSRHTGTKYCCRKDAHTHYWAWVGNVISSKHT